MSDGWKNLGCRIPAAGEVWRDGNCSPLDSVYHVAHIPEALQILKDRRIKRHRVDDGRLAGQLRVVWMSGNNFGVMPGSVYGTIQFRFRRRDLIDGKDIYWVETVPGRQSYRFLVSAHDHSNTAVDSYDVDDSPGPLRRLSGHWYFNSSRTSQFMLDRNVPLSLCNGIELVQHNECPRHGTNRCTEVDKNLYEIGARFLAAFFGNRRRHGRRYFLDGDHLNADIGNSLFKLYQDLSEGLPARSNRTVHHPRSALRSAMVMYSKDDLKRAQRKARRLRSRATVKATLKAIVRRDLKNEEIEIRLK